MTEMAQLKNLELLKNLTIGHIGKLLRKNEELQKKKGENNGSKMKKIGDRNYFKKLKSEEQLKKPAEKKTKKPSKHELKQNDNVVRQKLRQTDNEKRSS